MFRKINHTLNGIRVELIGIGNTLRHLPDALQDMDRGGADPDRVSALEGRMESILGIVEAGITKGEALKATALAAEDRARHQAKRAEKYATLISEHENGDEADSFAEIGKAFQGVVPDGDDEAEPAVGVQVLPHSVADRRAGREAAKAAKRR